MLVDTLRDQGGERLKATLNEGTRRVNMKIGLNLHGAKVEESFKTHTPYLGEEVDRGTKTT